MEELFISSQDQNHQKHTEPHSSIPPPLPHHPPSPSSEVFTVTKWSSATAPLPAVSPPSDQVYLQAAAIFQQMYKEKPMTEQLLHYGKKTDTALPESGDRRTQRRAYQLAFNTLKYQDLLEAIIADSCFHTSQHIAADLLPLAMVMLFDFQDRNFLLHKRPPKEGEELQQEVRDLERGLYRCKTKLAASLARCRVKQSLQSISCFLSDTVRIKQHRAKSLPLYAWVNALTHSVEEVCDALRGEGLSEETNASELRETSFCRDALSPDTLLFSHRLHARLQQSSLTRTHTLNIQDSSVCVAVSALRPLLPDEGDVLLAGSFSAVTVCHVSVLAAAGRSGRRVLVCGGDHTAAQRDEINQQLTLRDVKNVRVLSSPFSGLDEWSSNTQHLKVIAVLPQCSSSGLNDPVQLIHSEHGDWDLLQDLAHGGVSQRRRHTLAAQQERLLTHALTFSKVQTVLYCTRSVYPEENEQLVQKVLEKARTNSRMLRFRVDSPVFSEGFVSEGPTDKFFRLQPSQHTNGCFIAQLGREVDSVQDVLARAAAKGLLFGIIPNQLKTSKKGRSKKSDVNKRLSPCGQGTPAETERDGVGGEDPGCGFLVTPSGCDEERGKGSSSEDEEGGKGDREGEDEERKLGRKRGGKRKVRRRRKQTDKTATVSRSPRKKPAKKKVNTTHHIRRKAKVKLPPLTKTLTHTHTLSQQHCQDTADTENTHTTSKQTLSCPVPWDPHKASNQAQECNTQIAQPGSPLKAGGKEARPKMRTQEVAKAADFVLPPICSPTPSSLSSRSVGSVSRPSSQASNIQLSRRSSTSSSSSSSSSSVSSEEKSDEETN
ncbi:putative methyltransferase NSUN7 [Genypterus blacodes]|uniref:putative methyltransferase NSUN7 n=1 Tax=Genypterus blacodes TaxID=154954 RepID=UPI003F75F0E4